MSSKWCCAASRRPLIAWRVSTWFSSKNLSFPSDKPCEGTHQTPASSWHASRGSCRSMQDGGFQQHLEGVVEQDEDGLAAPTVEGSVEVFDA